MRGGRLVFRGLQPAPGDGAVGNPLITSRVIGQETSSSSTMPRRTGSPVSTRPPQARGGGLAGETVLLIAVRLFDGDVKEDVAFGRYQTDGWLRVHAGLLAVGPG